MEKFNFIVIGSGIAGLNFALNAAEKGKVLVITKKDVADSSTNYAQGGISAVLDKTDSFEQHVSDTMKAGADHNVREAVEFMVKQAPEAIRRLIEFGVEFDEDKGHIDLRLEGGHTKNRIVHVGDYTGQAIEEALVNRVKEHQGIEIWEDAFALDLLVKDGVCFGVRVIKGERVENIFGGQTVIATGGLGQIYEFTSNPEISTGDGLAMANRVGAKFRDLEFVQFHPTAFCWEGSVRFLLTEALRGEGAFLCHSDGERFLEKYDQRADLAPRDVVARAVYLESKKGPVYLNFPEKEVGMAEIKFPHIYQMLAEYNLKLGVDLIPVMAAAHYLCGGIETDLKGRTNIENLFAFGEVAWTGVHGANRLGSNSLLEALVFSGEIVEQLERKSFDDEVLEGFGVVGYQSAGDLNDVKAKVRKIMWDKVGIVRKMRLLNEALEELNQLKKEVELQLANGVNEGLAVVQNMVTVAILVTKAALKRDQSLGGHILVND